MPDHTESTPGPGKTPPPAGHGRARPPRQRERIPHQSRPSPPSVLLLEHFFDNFARGVPRRKRPGRDTRRPAERAADQAPRRRMRRRPGRVPRPRGRHFLSRTQGIHVEAEIPDVGVPHRTARLQLVVGRSPTVHRTSCHTRMRPLWSAAGARCSATTASTREHSSCGISSQATRWATERDQHR